MIRFVVRVVVRFVARIVLALTLAGALVVPLARAQAPETEDNRYQFNRVEDGYLRLDLRNGQVSLCSRRSVGWACVTVPDDRAAFDGEIARLQGENVALKKAMLDRGLPLPGGVTAEAPVARSERAPERDLKMPSNQDIDRMMTAVEKVWRRLVDMLMNLQKDLMKKT
jgi:hypothetical protein